MTKTLETFTRELPDPQELWDESETAAQERPEYCTHIHGLPNAENFSLFKIEDGAGAEGVLVVRKAEGGLIDAALLYTYDHESHLTANIEDIEGAEVQPALMGLPETFNPVLTEGSPLFWNYDGYPATHNHIFATAAVWYVEGAWHHAPDLNTAQDFNGKQIDDTEMVRQFYSIFRGIGF